MNIKNLSVTHFRNLASVNCAPSKTVNVIYGENGSGKTNLVEAMWLCTGLRSFRGGSSRQYIGFSEPFSRIDLTFDAFRRTQEIELLYERAENQRRYKLNGVKRPSATALSGHFCSVVFSPDHLELISGGPEERRRFLDNAISQIRPHYEDLCQKYQKTLLQRNHLLRQMDGLNGAEKEVLEIWNESLVGFGTAIMEYRAAYIQGLSARARFYYAGISGGRETLKIKYQSTVPLPGNSFSIKDVGNQYRDKLQAALPEDIKMGYTTVGIHREDIKIFLNDKTIRFYGSQGQKRSAVISLKLAESDEIAQNIGEEPVIFLDDVMSELDENRQKYILEHLNNRQIFITGCDPLAFSSAIQGKRFKMDGGVLTEDI